MHSKNIKLIFDGRILRFLNNHNPSRSGIFFSTYNLFLEFSRRYDFYLYSDISSDYINRQNFPHLKHLSKDKSFGSFLSYFFFLSTKMHLPRILSKLFSAGLLLLGRLKLRYKDLDKGDERIVFFSPFMAIPKEFRGERYLCFTLLHDCIPLVFDDFPKPDLLRRFLGGGGLV